MAESIALVETLRGLLDAFNRHDLEGVLSFLTEDCVMDLPQGPHPWGDRFTGQAEIRDALEERFDGLPDVNYADAQHWVTGDFGASVWTVTGTTLGGAHLHAHGCDHFTFRGGKIARMDTYWKIIER